ncbi:MAG: hypothetical protein KC503_46470 [Myxococcales bacterium]|nr:hypothetical protein [Myxococcales bacterium]
MGSDSSVGVDGAVGDFSRSDQAGGGDGMVSDGTNSDGGIKPPADVGAADVFVPPVPDGSGADGSSSGQSKATVTLTYSGCSASFAGTNHVIVQNDTLTVSSVASGGLSASLQLVLKQTSGTITLSTKHRQQTGTVVNLVTGGTTYTNITFDTAVYTGQKPDPIKGTITINKLSFATGVADVRFSGVTLENVGASHGHCTLDGTVVTTGKSF